MDQPALGEKQKALSLDIIVLPFAVVDLAGVPDVNSDPVSDARAPYLALVAPISEVDIDNLLFHVLFGVCTPLHEKFPILIKLKQ